MRKGDTFKTISQTSLVYDPFLDFDPRGDAMKMYVKSLHATSNGEKGFNGSKCNDEVESGRVGITHTVTLNHPEFFTLKSVRFKTYNIMQEMWEKCAPDSLKHGAITYHT